MVSMNGSLDDLSVVVLSLVLQDSLFSPASLYAVLDALLVIHLKSHLSVFVPPCIKPIVRTVVVVAFMTLHAIGVPMNPFSVLLTISIPTHRHELSVAIPPGIRAIGNVIRVMLFDAFCAVVVIHRQRPVVFSVLIL